MSTLPWIKSYPDFVSESIELNYNSLIEIYETAVSKFGTQTYANNINTDTLDSSFIQYKSNNKIPTHNTGLVFLHNN